MFSCSYTFDQISKIFCIDKKKSKEFVTLTLTNSSILQFYQSEVSFPFVFLFFELLFCKKIWFYVVWL